MTGVTLGARFESSPNGLNAIRLVLAGTVVVWHAYALAGHAYLPAPAEQLLGDVPVDAFFAISGFLICRAWTRRPELRRFAEARARRILPGLWACLVVTAFVIAPLATGSLDVGASARFVLGNASSWVTQWSIDGGPSGVPVAGAWNGSLWSLGYEAACYIAVAALGIAGLLRRHLMLWITCGFWLAGLAMAVVGLESEFGLLRVPRIGLMFACGALLWLYRDHLRLTSGLALASLTLVAVGAFAPDYRLVAAPAVAYLALHVSLTLRRWPRMVLTNDLSYGLYVYAFPVQQALLLAGITTGWAAFAVVSLACTLPIAAASWFMVERPALRGRASGGSRVVGGESGRRQGAVVDGDLVDHPIPLLGPGADVAAVVADQRVGRADPQ